MRDEIDLDVELDRVGDDRRDKNLYKELIVNNAIKIVHHHKWSNGQSLVV